MGGLPVGERCGTLLFAGRLIDAAAMKGSSVLDRSGRVPARKALENTLTADVVAVV